jgi:long-chain acyl-CoA synthetase
MEPLIAQAVVVGDDRPYLTALLTVDTEAAVEWAEHDGRSFEPAGFEALTTDPDLRAELDRAVERVNAIHSHAEGSAVGESYLTTSPSLTGSSPRR